MVLKNLHFNKPNHRKKLHIYVVATDGRFSEPRLLCNLSKKDFAKSYFMILKKLVQNHLKICNITYW